MLGVTRTFQRELRLDEDEKWVFKFLYATSRVSFFNLTDCLFLWPHWCFNITVHMLWTIAVKPAVLYWQQEIIIDTKLLSICSSQAEILCHIFVTDLNSCTKSNKKKPTTFKSQSSYSHPQKCRGEARMRKYDLVMEGGKERSNKRRTEWRRIRRRSNTNKFLWNCHATSHMMAPVEAVLSQLQAESFS